MQSKGRVLGNEVVFPIAELGVMPGDLTVISKESRDTMIWTCWQGSGNIVRSFLLLMMAVWAGTATALSDQQKIKVEEACKLVYVALKAHNPRDGVDVSRVEN
jgi:hypothetical protein